MTILVTGGAGYIGGHMALRLSDLGEDFVIVDDMSNGVEWAVPQGVELVRGSVGDAALMRDVIAANRIDTIIHFAATLIMPHLANDPLAYYRNNAMASCTLLQAAIDGGVGRFLYSGTSAVYGDPAENPVAETAAIVPKTPYGKSKLVLEHMLADAAAVSDLDYVVLRYFNVAGADPQARYGQSTTRTTLLVQLAVQAALGRREGLTIFGTDYPTPDGTCVRDYLHVTDLIDAHEAALGYLRDGGKPETWNVGYGHGYSVRDIIDTVKRVTGRDFPVTEGPPRAGDPIAVVADAARIRTELGWTPNLDDIDAIVRHAWNWEQQMVERSL